jgi:CheY-like chemotaxis protein
MPKIADGKRNQIPGSPPPRRRTLASTPDRETNRRGRGVSVPEIVDTTKTSFATGRPKAVDAGINSERGRRAGLDSRLRYRQRMELIGVLTGGIAHDINNVLLPIQINAEMILLEGRPDGQSVERLRQILTSVRRGRDLVRQILSLSQQNEKDLRAINIAPVVEEAVKFIRVTAPPNIRVTEHIQSPAAFIRGDPVRIFQLILTLAAAAIEAMGSRAGGIEIGLSDKGLSRDDLPRPVSDRPGASVTLSIRDSRAGRTPEVEAADIGKYFAGRRRGPGRDHGASVVRGIVKAHGGLVTFSSSPARGTEVDIDLPQVSEPKASKLPPGEELPKGSERVLFVDDEELQVRAMTRLLEHLGYKVTAASAPRRALETLRRRPGMFDLLITDQRMPDMTGAELARKVARIRPELPVILCTGFLEASEKEAGLTPNIRASVMKPFSASEIAAVIRRVLDAARNT